MTLNGKQRHHLRGLGHSLDAIVSIGKEGLTEAFVAAVNQALADHELIKVRVLDTTGLDRNDAAEELAKATHSEVAQVLGNTFLLYKPHPEKPAIELP